MKIYIQDNGKLGCLVAVAYTEEQAREIMRQSVGYSEDQKVFEISPTIGTLWQRTSAKCSTCPNFKLGIKHHRQHHNSW